MKTKQIIFIILSIIVFANLIVSIILSSTTQKKEIKEVACYDENYNVIKGLTCEDITYRGPYKVYFFISLGIFLLLMVFILYYLEDPL